MRGDSIKYSVGVLGASGNTGHALVKQLLLHPRIGNISLYGRRLLDEFKDDRITQYQLDMDVDSLEASAADIPGVDAVFNVMGAGKPSTVSKDELLRVDCTLPSIFAKVCKAKQVRHFAALTAFNADSSATYSRFTGTTAVGGWYSHCKGQLEDNLTGLGFESLAIYRPAGLIGTTSTPASVVFMAPYLDKVLPASYKHTHIDQLCAGMVERAVQALDSKLPSTQVVDGDALREFKTME